VKEKETGKSEREREETYNNSGVNHSAGLRSIVYAPGDGNGSVR
jgi:hypothetical protein